jgi:hypothetical protein
MMARKGMIAIGYVHKLRSPGSSPAKEIDSFQDCWSLSFSLLLCDSLIWYSGSRLLRLGYKRRDFSQSLVSSWTTRPFLSTAGSLSLFPFAALSQTSVDEIMICKVMIKDESGQVIPVPMQLWNSPDSRQPSNIIRTYTYISECV